MKNEDVKHIDLTTDLTQTDFMDLLNKKFGGKSFSTKKSPTIVPFNQQDIQGYVRRGFLPKKYGSNKIKVIKGSGLVVLRVKDIEKIRAREDFKLEK